LYSPVQACTSLESLYDSGACEGTVESSVEGAVGHGPWQGGAVGCAFFVASGAQSRRPPGFVQRTGPNKRLAIKLLPGAIASPQCHKEESSWLL
jgi:hypothetical protein